MTEALSPELAEALREFFENSPMRSVVVGPDDDSEEIIAVMKAKGFHVGAVSNAGLRNGDVRITFLKEECFEKDPKPVRKRKQMHVQEYLDRIEAGEDPQDFIYDD